MPLSADLLFLIHTSACLVQDFFLHEYVVCLGSVRMLHDEFIHVDKKNTLLLGCMMKL